MKARDLWRRLAAHAVHQPEAVALDDGSGHEGGSGQEGDGRQVTWEQLLPAVTSAAASLRASGVSCLGVLADNGLDAALADLGALALGITVVPLPGFFTDEQLRHVLARAGVDGLLTDQVTRMARLAPEGWQSSGALGALTLFRIQQPKLLPANGHGGKAPPARVTFTSGTTGVPKGVCLSEEALLCAAVGLCEATEMGRHDRHLSVLPASILLENVGGLYRGLWAGARVMLPGPGGVGLEGSSDIDPKTLALALQRSEATSAILMPQMLAGLVAWCEAAPSTPRFELSFVGVGGAIVPIELQQRAAAVGLPVFVGYGLSEACSVVALNTRRARRLGSVGKPLPHVSVSIAEDGEVCVRGVLFDGYLPDPDCESARTSLEPNLDGSWPTGDLGHLDSDGYLYIHGRRDDLLVSSFGRNVQPEWVEQELCALPDVREAAVVADGHPGWVVVIVTESGASLSAGELARLNQRLPDYARVSRGITAREGFQQRNHQRDGDGRLLRDVIAQEYAHELAAPTPHPHAG